MKGVTADGTYHIDWAKKRTDHPVILTYGWIFGSRNRVLCNGTNVSHLPIRRLKTGADGEIVYLKEVGGKFLFHANGDVAEESIRGNVEYFLMEREDQKIEQRRKDDKRADL